jgi:CDP-diacylglycerol--glycerol-3-phosphate 3-phosphatidyltransferase
MLKRVRVPLQRVLGPVANWLNRHGAKPDVVTAIGTVCVATAALVLYPRGDLFWGSFIITIFVFTDMIDGALARAQGRTGPWGAFLDSNLDRIADGAVFGGLLWWFIGRGDQPVLAGLCGFCLFAANLISYARARAEGLGLRGDIGIAERTERLIVFLTATGISGLGVPYIQAIGLWVLAAAILITIGQRFVYVYRQAHKGADDAFAGDASSGDASAGDASAGHGRADGDGARASDSVTAT